MSGHLNSFVYTVCLKGVDYMTKTKSIILCLVILIAIFSGCSTQETNSKPEVQANTINAITNEITAEQETSESETTTQKSDNSETTVANKARPAEQKSTGRTTTKKSTATQKQTTTKRQTTTKKVTTTQKPATTKKVTTTEDDWDCNVDGHSCEVGPIGWVNSEAEATDKALEYIASHDASGNFRIRECYWCGKYTAKITLD